MELIVHPCVYEPAEDTELAIEALLELKRMGRRYERIADLGTGTGILAKVAHALFAPRVLAAIDISPFAVAIARRNLPPEAHVVRCDGLCVGDRWDLVILNPPYLPHEPPARPEGEEWLDLAWSGAGVMERLVREALDRSREALVILSSLYPLELEGEEMGRRKFFFEDVFAVLARGRG